MRPVRHVAARDPVIEPPTARFPTMFTLLIRDEYGNQSRPPGGAPSFPATFQEKDPVTSDPTVKLPETKASPKSLKLPVSVAYVPAEYVHVPPDAVVLPKTIEPTTSEELKVRLPPAAAAGGKFAALTVPVKYDAARDPANAPAVIVPATTRLPAFVAPPVTEEYWV